MRLDTGGEHIQRFHGFVIAVHIILYHFHGLQLFQAGLFGNLVLSIIRIVLQMTYIGDVTDITYLVTQMGKITEQDIESNGRTCMSGGLMYCKWLVYSP